MADLWYPGGVPDPAPSGVWGEFTDHGEPKFLLHTTESRTGAYHPSPFTGDSRRRYYGNTGTWPNYTLAWHTASNRWRVYNHIPANRSSLSLRNRAGGVQTNRDNVTQVEVAARAAEIRFLPDEALGELARLLAWEHLTRGVPLASTVRWVAYPASYGERAPQRLSGPAWDAYAGVLGHQHAPENDHGDPGDFPIENLLALAREHLAPPRPPEGDVDLTLTPEQLRAIGTEAAAAWHALVWGQMQTPPDNAPPGWHPPYQRDVGSLVRRGYEMTGAIWADLADLRAAVDAHAGPVARSASHEPLSFPGLLDGVYEAGGAAALAELAVQATARLAWHVTQPVEEAPA
jgi:hypothetical protein